MCRLWPVPTPGSTVGAQAPALSQQVASQVPFSFVELFDPTAGWSLLSVLRCMDPSKPGLTVLVAADDDEQQHCGAEPEPTAAPVTTPTFRTATV